MMGKRAREIESWRRVCHDEPIYYAPPRPSSPSDIIYSGSDDGIDAATRAAKRQRYEEHGRRFLQGRPPRLISASLRGPFDKASGWQNPWLPKPSSYPVTLSAVQAESNTPAGKLSDEEDQDEDDTAHAIYDSIDCHLPSPQSQQDFDFTTTPSRSEKRARIRVWADAVHEGALEKDEFWAPGPTEHRNTESSAKRPASGDWLKRRPAKRRNLQASQGTEATYTHTPTPMLPAQSRVQRKKESAIRRSVNHSLEMTTPSSSPDQGPRESLDPVEQRSEALHEKSRPAPSTVSTGTDRMRTKSVTRHEEMEEIGIQEDSDKAESARTFEKISQNQSQRQLSRDYEEAEESIDFEDRADQSFCYQARQLRQTKPRAALNSSVVNCSSQNVQIKKSMSPGKDIVNVLSSSSSESSSLSQSDAKTPEEPSIAAAAKNEGDHHTAIFAEPGHSQIQSLETTVRMPDITRTNAVINEELRVNNDRPLNDITSNSMLNRHNTVPQTLLEIKEAHGTRTSLSLDESPTLVADPADMEETAERIQSALQSPNTLSFECSSRFQYQATPISSGAANNQSSTRCDVEASNDTSVRDATSNTTIAVPWQETPGLQKTAREALSQYSQRESAGSFMSVDAIVNKNDESIHQTIAESQAVPINPQSPWAPLPAVSAGPQHDNDVERVGDKLEMPPAQSHVALFTSPTLMHCSPTIRPSQQSPWARENTEIAKSMRPEGVFSTSTALISDITLAREYHSPTLPVSQGHPWASTSPIIPPVTKPGHQFLNLDVSVDKSTVSSIQVSPSTPVLRTGRQSTPEREMSIRSFSNFNASPLQQTTCPPTSSTSRGILSTKKYPSTQTSAKSTRRVSFASLPHEQGTDSDQPSTNLRAASPPPPKLVNTEEEHLDGKYRNHFDVMNRRFSVNKSPNCHFQTRLLPSSSQRKPETPSVGAMAEAFREADALHPGDEYEVDNGIKIEPTEETAQETLEQPQSPWQHDSQGIDHVAAVIGNLSEFLDAWDVDTEMNQNRIELKKAEDDDVTRCDFPGVGNW